MIVIGDKLIPFEEFFKINSTNDIKNTKANSTVLFNYSDEIAKFCFENEISFAIVVDSIKEAVYSSNLNAKYIITNKELSKELQKIADNYMYDAKILVIIESSDEFEEIAKAQIDGVIFKNLI